MRTVPLAVVTAFLALSSSLPASGPQQGAQTLTGRVIAGAGQDVKPVRRARVTLSGAGLPSVRVGDTDTSGAYRFDRIPAGNYTVTIEKPGFVKLETPAPRNAILTLVRGSAIEGVVRDASGDPVWNVAVAVYEAGGAGAPRMLRQVRSDDLGRYRLHSLPEGDYIVQAATDAAFLQRVFVMQGEKRPAAERVYYPAAAAIEQARPVRVLAGRDTTAIDLTFAISAPARDPAAPPAPPRPDATGTARIAGKVLDQTSGKPIRTARLLMVPIDGQRLTNWTRTDTQGRFEYASLQARRYELRAQADGYVTLEFGQKRPGETGKPILLADGEHFVADFQLPRASAIEGALVDEFGDPAPGLLVQVARRTYAAGRYRLMPIGAGPQPALSDDLGRYRVIGLEPGDYYVMALGGAYADMNGVGGFAPTYYPGSMDSGAAVPVPVTFAADTQAPFAMAPAHTFTVAGTMVGGDGRPVSGRGSLWLATPDSLQRADFNLARGVTGPDGRFMLRNVPQGVYTLQGFGPPPPDYRGPMNLGAMTFGWLPISVGDADLDDVVLEVSGGTTLRGRIVLEDAAAAPPTSQQVRVTAIPVEFDSAPVGGGPPPSQTNDDLTFEVTRLSGMRRILASLSTPTWALKRIMVNGRDVTDVAVDFRTKDVEDVEVVLTGRVTRLSGGVSDDKGPVTDYAVVIFPSDPTKWTDRSRFLMMARPTQDGRFDLHGLAPEEYLAIALPSVEGSEWQNPDFLQQLRPRATPFTLNEGEARTLQLTIQKRP